jgi:hypothetical protein
MTTERRLHEPTAARRPPSFGASESRCGRGVTTPGCLGAEDVLATNTALIGDD